MEIRHILIINYDICFTLNGAKLWYISIDRINFKTIVWWKILMNLCKNNENMTFTKNKIDYDGYRSPMIQIRHTGWWKTVRVMQSRHTIFGGDVFPSYFEFTTTKNSYFYHELYSVIHTTCALFQDAFLSLNYDTTWQLETDRTLVICLTWSTQI